MTNTSRRVGFILGAAVLVAAAGISARAQNTSPSFAAQGGSGGPGFGGRGAGGRMGRGGPMGPGASGLPLGQLNLTPQQQDQVKSIMESHKDELKGLNDRETTAREALEAAVSANTLDENIIRARAADLSVVEADVAVARAHVRAEVFQVLTPDQQKQAAALEGQRPPRGRGPGRS